MTKKHGSNYGATVHVAGIDPETYIVTAIVMRRDGAPLDANELAMCAKALPDVQPVKSLLAENERFERAASARHPADAKSPKKSKTPRSSGSSKKASKRAA